MSDFGREMARTISAHVPDSASFEARRLELEERYATLRARFLSSLQPRLPG
jgi:hypothetical protein